MYEILPFGDTAVLVNFEQKIDPIINQKVITLSQKIVEAKINGFQSCMPAYCSLTVYYDSTVVRFSELEKKINKLYGEINIETEIKTRKLLVPVCYGGKWGEDLAEIAEQKNLSPQAIINLHISQTYRVYMLGFLPGFAYMGKLPEALYVSRKSFPRLKVKAGSVGLAGFQTGIYPSEAPGGWQLIGQTPLTLFNPDSKPHFLFNPGDEVQFYQINERIFEEIREEVLKGKFDLNRMYES